MSQPASQPAINNREDNMYACIYKPFDFDTLHQKREEQEPCAFYVALLVVVLVFLSESHRCNDYRNMLKSYPFSFSEFWSS